MIILENNTIEKPRTLAEFVVWEQEQNDGFKYELNDGELIKFSGMNKKQVYIFEILNRLFIRKGLWEQGTFLTEYDVMLSGIQMRRPDIAYLTNEQVRLGKEGEDVIPEFMIEIISESDQQYKIEEKLTEYFKAGVKIVWNIIPESQLVYVYSSRKNVMICSDDDICSAEPVLPDFKIAVNDIFVN
jgi:Uma2 family endonuclease